MSAAAEARHRRLAAALEACLAQAPGPCLLAVSGGPDSTALMHLAAERGRGPLRVATVDHGLRPESRAEAEAVAAAAAALGLPHAHLAWTGPHPAAGLQAAARAARYRLLAAEAARCGAGLVLTGHTRDDQAETVLMRLVRGSGPAGLAGMRAARALAPGVTLARPFLGVAKAELTAWCEARGIAYLRDPSNADPRFARARLRATMPLLAAEGLTAERLLRLAERAARDEAALAEIARARFAGALGAGADGPLVLAAGALDGPDAVALRVLALAAEAAGGAEPWRLERLERLAAALRAALQAGQPLRRTFRGLLFDLDGQGRLSLSAAPPRRQGRGAAAPPELLGKG